MTHDTDDSESRTNPAERVLTRREALRGGSAAAVAVGAGIYSDALVERAQALQAGDARIVMGDQGESPTQDGEITLNAPDVEVYSGGAVRNLTNIGSGGGLSTTVVSANYTTQDEDVVYVDESAGAVTVKLASADVMNGNEIEVVNMTGTNTVTVDTEGTETIDPGGETSKTITEAAWGVAFIGDGTNWSASVAGEFEAVTIDGADVTGETFVSGHLDTSITGISSGTFTNYTDTEDEDVKNEFNTNFEFNPAETGYYKVIGKCQFASITEGDRLTVQLRDTTNNTPEDNNGARMVAEIGASNPNNQAPTVAGVFKLDSTNTYEPLGRDITSSYEMEFGYFHVSKAVVHP